MNIFGVSLGMKKYNFRPAENNDIITWFRFMYGKGKKKHGLIYIYIDTIW